MAPSVPFSAPIPSAAHSRGSHPGCCRNRLSRDRRNHWFVRGPPAARSSWEPIRNSNFPARRGQMYPGRSCFGRHCAARNRYSHDQTYRDPRSFPDRYSLAPCWASRSSAARNRCRCPAWRHRSQRCRLTRYCGPKREPPEPPSSRRTAASYRDHRYRFWWSRCRHWCHDRRCSGPM